MMSRIPGEILKPVPSPPKEQLFDFGPWKVITLKSHILKSQCESQTHCKDSLDLKEFCTFCRYNAELSLPQLPEMLFPDNKLRLEHEKGFGIIFSALDALRLVDNKRDLMKVAVADAWKEARADSQHNKEVLNPFDWTFTTDYKGTIFFKDGELKITNTEEKIDIEKLKVREKILFYDDLHLFEDELADNGCAMLSVKIRVMEGCFFILLRYFLRVDDVIIRTNDTRFYHEADKSYILREFTRRESKIKDLKVSPSLFTDPNEIWQHLELQEECREKLEFPI